MRLSYRGAAMRELASTLATTPVAAAASGLRSERLMEAAGRAGDDQGWRRLTQSTRDLSPMTADRMREIAVYLYTYNPLARKLINLTGEWVWGEGVTFDVPVPRAQDYLQKAWKSRASGWRRRGEQRVRELYLFGEQALPLFTNEFNGRISLGTLDPSRIKEVVVDPDNAQMPIGLVTKSTLGQDERRLRTALMEDDELLVSEYGMQLRAGFADGEVFLSSVNNLSNSTRGLSEIFSLADSLDGYEQFLWLALQNEQIRTRVLWDVEIQGADDKRIKDFLADNPPPKPLTVRAHNEKVKWTMVGPDMGAASANTESARLQRNHILGGAGVPEHYFGGGGDVNRAAAAEMGGPFEKQMNAKQRTVEYVIEDYLTIQVERGIRSGALTDEEGIREITVSMPDLSTRDPSRVGQALASVTAAMVQSEEQGWIDAGTSTRVLASLIGQMGVKVDADDMLAAARKQKSDSMREQVTRDLVDHAAA